MQHRRERAQHIGRVTKRFVIAPASHSREAPVRQPAQDCVGPIRGPGVLLPCRIGRVFSIEVLARIALRYDAHSQRKKWAAFTIYEGEIVAGPLDHEW